jgi:hypothetical protein
MDFAPPVVFAVLTCVLLVPVQHPGFTAHGCARDLLQHVVDFAPPPVALLWLCGLAQLER